MRIAAGRLLAIAPLVVVLLVAGNLVRVLDPPTSPDCRADVALVMGAAQYDGRPSPALARRLSRALTLYEDGCVDRIVVSGGGRPGDRTSEGASGVAWLRARGVPGAALAAETRATTSAENVRFARPLVGDGPVVVVTDDLHLVRSLALARHAGWDASGAAAVVPSDRLRYAVREAVALTAHQVGLE